MKPRCDHCPVVPRRPCRGQTHRRLCELVDHRHPDFDAGYVAILVALAAEARTPEPQPPAGETIRLLAIVKRCPFRSIDPGCGCSGARCALRPAAIAVVSARECLDCVRQFGV
jgi:hypothetical protein